MPLAREAAKRMADEIAVPEPGEDPAERKRLLNVLAQRRYRQRRKQHVKNLEVQAGKVHGQPEDSQSPDDTTSEQLPLPSSESVPIFELPPESVFQQTEPLQQDQLFDDPFAMFDPNFVAFPTDLQPDWNPQLPSFPNSPSSTTDPSDLSLTPFASPRSSPRTSTYSFSDDAYLEISQLNLLRGAMAIAKRLKVEDIIWSLESASPFTANSPGQFQHLPPNLRPTAMQLSQPHHPVFDILPWPTVRDRLILIFSQPPEFRPKSAASPTALMELVYDIEDDAEGVRICGDDPYSDQAWEVGDKLFHNWWWAFDRDVVRRSNEMRRQRGAGALGMPGGSVLGEVA